MYSLLLLLIPMSLMCDCHLCINKCTATHEDLDKVDCSRRSLTEDQCNSSGQLLFSVISEKDFHSKNSDAYHQDLEWYSCCGEMSLFLINWFYECPKGLAQIFGSFNVRSEGYTSRHYWFYTIQVTVRLSNMYTDDVVKTTVDGR